MTVTLADHGKTVQTKQTVNGETTFQVPSNTAGVRFDASCEGYTGSRAISGPTVYGELLALGFVSSGLLSGIAFVDGLPKWLNGIAPARIVRRILFVALPVAALIFPISYLVFEEPGWYGTGWAPASMLGIPIYLAPLAPVALTLLRYAWPARWPCVPWTEKKTTSGQAALKKKRRKNANSSGPIDQFRSRV
jgi:hypothetical protein